MRRLLYSLLLVPFGCFTRTPDVDLGGSTFEVVASVPPAPNHDIDILFVIDDSGSMGDHQKTLAQWAQDSLFGVLTRELGTEPNLHVAVVTSDFDIGDWSISGCIDQDDGRFQTEPELGPPEGLNCSPPDGSFLIDVANGDGTRTRNYTGDLGDAFACMALVGTNGCGFEQHLAAMRRALDGSVPENHGFLRPNALLLVVIVADEDDCSASNTALYDSTQESVEDPLGPTQSFRCFEFGVVCDGDDPRTTGEKTACRPRDDSAYLATVASYADFLTSLKADATAVMVAGIFGEAGPVLVGLDSNEFPELQNSCPPPEPACPSVPDASTVPDAAPYDGMPDSPPWQPPPPVCPITATPAIRLASFLDRFPGRNRSSSICGGDMSGALGGTARLTASVAGAKPCLLGSIKDIQPDAEGLQSRCRAFDVTAPRTTAEQRSSLPSCDDTGGREPCFRLEADSSMCGGSETSLAVRVARSAPAPTGSHIVVECLTD